jgi:small subunit ribosomal protein S18
VVAENAEVVDADAETVAAEDIAAEVAAPAVEAVRGPSGYVESEGGRPSRIGTGVKPADVDYKNIALLSRFLDRRGRILSRRKTRVSAKVQRRVAQAIKRARHLALLPYTSDQTRVVRKRR